MEYKEALSRAARLCSRQEQASGHIKEKLNGWNVSEEDALRILDVLKEEKYLDDKRFAAFYARDKFRFNGWGKVKLSAMLRQKGITQELIEKALDQIDDAAYFRKCARLIADKSATLKDSNQFTRKGKLYRFAAQRGFESDLIHRVLNMEEME